jgi:hypothetical protein
MLNWIWFFAVWDEFEDEHVIVTNSQFCHWDLPKSIANMRHVIIMVSFVLANSNSIDPQGIETACEEKGGKEHGRRAEGRSRRGSIGV